jgi:Mrp family chromosome partitioning ATPase/capsular polysaccharide biosynthesis protein
VRDDDHGADTATMDLLSYFRVLRRRWLLILVFVVVGAGLGAASTALNNDDGKAPTYYKATSTLVLDPSLDNDSSNQLFTSVEQVSILVTTGGVPDAVAKQVGTTERGRELAEKVVTLTNSVPNTLEITVVDPNAQRAVELSNAFADQLIKAVDQRGLDRFNKARDEATKQVNSLKTQADGFLAQIVTNPPDIGTLQRQYDATQNEYYNAYQRLQTLNTQGPPENSLSKLEGAAAVPIGQTEYDSRLSLGASGQNHLREDGSVDGGEAAITVSSSSGPNIDDPVSRGALGAFIGLVAGVGLALVLDRLDHRIRNRTDAESAYGLPVLAEVPKFTRAQQRDRDIVTVAAPLSRAAEAYRAIRTSLLFQQASALADTPDAHALNGNGHSLRDTPLMDSVFEPEQQGKMVIMVTSASPREGKTNTSANLAAVFAEGGASVLIVNCDFRRPTIHRLLNLEDVPRTVQDTSIAGVKIVTNVLADPNANPSQVVAAQRQVIAAARARFDVIILDTAPILTANDAIEVVGATDLVLLIARSEVTTTDNAERTMEILTRLEAPLGGIVLVGAAQTTSDYYYYYQRGRVQSSSRRSAKRAPTPAPEPAPAVTAAPDALNADTDPGT